MPVVMHHNIIIWWWRIATVCQPSDYSSGPIPADCSSSTSRRRSWNANSSSVTPELMLLLMVQQSAIDCGCWGATNYRCWCRGRHRGRKEGRRFRFVAIWTSRGNITKTE